MQRSTTLRLFPLLSLLACDVPEDVDAPDRGDDEVEEVAFRTGPTVSGGSIRLNTAKLFDEGLPIRHFKENGGTTVYDDAKSTQVTFLRIELAAGGGVFEAATHAFQVNQGKLLIDGVTLQPGQLLGSRWRFAVSDSTSASRQIVLKITGVAIADVGGGALSLPLYNFSLSGPSTSFYDNGPYSACDKLDVNSRTVTYNLADMTPPTETNLFKLEYSAVLYGDTRVTEPGNVVTDATVATLACVSGAVGKAGLWGYPPWVTPFGGRSGRDQLQAATRAIRADFCGDGVSHTEDGTPIQVYDRYSDSFYDPREATESVWGTNKSTCRVTSDRLDSGAIFNCGGTLTTSCDKKAADWLNGSAQFMWIKVDPAMTPDITTHACNKVDTHPGCNDPGIEAYVCSGLPGCCTTGWNALCVSKAGSVGAADEACCSAHAGSGCGDPAVSACVGGFDSSCNVAWDDVCAQEVELLGCGVCS